MSPDTSCPSNISLIELVSARPGTSSIILPAINLFNPLIIPKCKHTIEQIAISPPQIIFIKKSFKLSFSRFIDTNLVKIPMKNAHKNYIIPPSNSMVNVEVANPAKNKVLYKG